MTSHEISDVELFGEELSTSGTTFERFRQESKMLNESLEQRYNSTLLRLISSPSAVLKWVNNTINLSTLNSCDA